MLIIVENLSYNNTQKWNIYSWFQLLIVYYTVSFLKFHMFTSLQDELVLQGWAEELCPTPVIMRYVSHQGAAEGWGEASLCISTELPEVTGNMSHPESQCCTNLWFIICLF